MVSSKSTKSPAFQFYPKDYLSSSKVQRMSNAERGIYTTLLAHCWLDNGLPTDLRALARLAGETPKVFERLWAGPLHECFAERAGKLHNERLDKERRIQAEYRKKQKENAEKRWQSHGISQTHPTAMPEARQSQTHAPLPQSSSASAIRKEEHTERARAGSSIVQRRRRDAAFEYGRLYVPQRAHDDLVMLANHGTDERALFAWYEGICEEYTNGAKVNTALPTDLIAFWKARYAERWPAAGAGSSTSKTPAWVAAARAKS